MQRQPASERALKNHYERTLPGTSAYSECWFWARPPHASLVGSPPLPPSFLGRLVRPAFPSRRKSRCWEKEATAIVSSLPGVQQELRVKSPVLCFHQNGQSSLPRVDWPHYGQVMPAAILDFLRARWSGHPFHDPSCFESVNTVRDRFFPHFCGVPGYGPQS